jgi:hypothetical protein
MKKEAKSRSSLKNNKKLPVKSLASGSTKAASRLMGQGFFPKGFIVSKDKISQNKNNSNKNKKKMIYMTYNAH